MKYTCPSISSSEDWDRLYEKTWADAERLASLIERLPESRLAETFVNEKYGNHDRCLQGLVEHNHYHLGQIALIKSIVQNTQG